MDASARSKMQRLKAPELRIAGPGGKTESIRLVAERVSLGRSRDNDLCYLEDAGLSREHLLLERTGAEWAVRDLGSKNGTSVNGARIDGRRVLRPGDRIAAGHLELTFSPEVGSSEQVVVFEKADGDSPSTSTVVTNLQTLLAEERAGGKLSPTGMALEMATRMRALIRAGRELASHRPLEDLFPVILDLALEAVNCNRGVLMSLEDDKLVVRAARGEGFRISAAVRDHVLKEKASLLVKDAQQDRAFRERLSIQEHGVRSMMAVPLQTADRVIGLIYLDSPSVFREFTREDLNLITVMANVAAIRIDHQRLVEVEQAERLMERELQQAAEIQRGLLPAAAPVTPGLDLAGYNAACRTVGGDYYDFLPFDDGRIAVLVADVSGKGMSAALLMSSLQARVQVLADEPDDLARMVTRLNRLISQNCPSNRFITFFICLIDPRTGEIAYSNAGHNPPLLVRRDGRVDSLDKCGGPPLGILRSVTYERGLERMEPGDVLVLYSDGVTEASNPEGEEFGEKGLAAVFRGRNEPAGNLIEDVIQAVADWTSNAPPADDITLAVIRRLA
ncbi:MAG: SpoIIE family protein phosphatase [Bryobacteraceae bacterium]